MDKAAGKNVMCVAIFEMLYSRFTGTNVLCVCEER